jgi:tetratricopeptide (TPR) repeat protein
MAIKVTTFLNLVVCKYKTKEFESIIGITDQIIEMDPNNVKCLYFRGKALIELKEYSKAVDCFTKLVHVDPNHAEGRKELENAKKIKK